MKATLKKVGESIDPTTLYCLREFYRVAGIGRGTVERAADLGIILPKLKVGRRVYIDGQQGIQFLKALARLSK